jgi:glycine/serine hydroxymethyltransferase
MENLKRKIGDIVARTERNSLWRQRECFNIIPSESTPSLIVKLCEISDPAGRYAEHRALRGSEVYFYQGIDFIRDVEEELRDALREYFGCREVEARPISGQMANEIVFKALTRYVRAAAADRPDRLALVMNNDLTKGGHLSSQPMGALFNYVRIDPETGRDAVLNFPVRQDDPYRIDAAAMVELIRQKRPTLIVFGKSMFLYPEPVAEARQALAGLDPAPVVMYDMAHTLRLYGAFQAPLAEGADIVTGSTHKTFFGTQRGVIACNFGEDHALRKLWTEIRGRAFPGSMSNHHLGTLLGLLVAACEMNHFRKDYQDQVRRNAKAFAQALKASGLEVEGDPACGFTETHQVIVRVRRYGTGEEVARRLEENNIICNYQALPDDESFVGSSGIRLGVQEMTRFGMAEADFSRLASFAAEVVMSKGDVKAEVATYRRNFQEMRYCLPPREACELGARVLAAIFPTSDYARRFADNLAAAASSASP